MVLEVWNSSNICLLHLFFFWFFFGWIGECVSPLESRQMDWVTDGEKKAKKRLQSGVKLHLSRKKKYKVSKSYLSFRGWGVDIYSRKRNVGGFFLISNEIHSNILFFRDLLARNSFSGVIPEKRRKRNIPVAYIPRFSKNYLIEAKDLDSGEPTRNIAFWVTHILERRKKESSGQRSLWAKILEFPREVLGFERDVFIFIVPHLIVGSPKQLRRLFFSPWTQSMSKLKIRIALTFLFPYPFFVYVYNSNSNLKNGTFYCCADVGKMGSHGNK